MYAKWLEVDQQSNARQSREESQRGADESVANDVQGFEVVAGVDLVLLQPMVVAANDVQVEIPDANGVQIGRHLIGACQGGSEKVDTLHGFPPRNFLRRPMN